LRAEVWKLRDANGDAEVSSSEMAGKNAEMESEESC
jgi:hypothetical protein